jgi:hypothetical protein
MAILYGILLSAAHGNERIATATSLSPCAHNMRDGRAASAASAETVV